VTLGTFAEGTQSDFGIVNGGGQSPASSRGTLVVDAVDVVPAPIKLPPAPR
jgi:hypothetical protein